MLEQKRGERLSGEDIAKRLGVTRSAVYKAVTLLRQEGLQIDATPGGGYCLKPEDDSLTAVGIRTLLKTEYIGRTIRVEQTLSSTNTVMKQHWLEQPDGFTLIAEEQTAGRGRIGRSFSSPPNTGIYLSILLHPVLPVEQIQLVTIAAAVAVAEAIEQTAGFAPQIKWVNDVLMEGRKLCGILTEANFEGESGSVHAVVVGIGVNLRPNPHWPEEIKAVAGALSEYGKPPRRAVLAAAVLSQFERAYGLLVSDRRALLARYRARLCCIDRQITVSGPGGIYQARCTGLDEWGHLLVCDEAGQEQTLSSGEISIRL